MAAAIQDFTIRYVPVRVFGCGFRCAKEEPRKAFRAALLASVTIFMQRESEDAKK